MPIYEYKCNDCGILFERFYSLKEYDRIQKFYVVICNKCKGEATQQISKTFGRVFKGQRLTMLSEEAPYAGSMREVKDHINRYNDSELAQKQGRVALADQ